MSDTSQFELLGTVFLNTEQYELVRMNKDDTKELSTSEEFGEEPPWEKGAPPFVTDAMSTWHLGGLKSRQGIPGTYEYGVDVNTSRAFMVEPSGLQNAVTLTSASGPVLSMFECLSYIWAVTAKRVYRIHPTTFAVTLSKDNSAQAYNFVQGIKWEGDYGIITTDDPAVAVWYVTAIGSPDTWGQSADTYAYYMAAGINRLFKITTAGELKNCLTGLSPVVNANWGDQVQIGDTSNRPTGLFAYERTVYAGKPEGLYGVGDNGLGMPVIKRTVREADNFRKSTVMDPWLLVPHVRGLYRYMPGNVESIGLEKELINEAGIDGRWKAFAIDGDFIYGALQRPSGDTFIMRGRERRAGESGFSPIVWDTWLYTNTVCQTMFISSQTTDPTLWIGEANNLAYVKLKNGPGAVEYATVGRIHTYKMRFDDWNPKDFPRVDMVGEQLSATKYWELSYSIDGAVASNLDINGAVMRMTTSGKQSFFLPTSAVGKEIQLIISYANNSTTVPPILRYVEVFAVPQSKKVKLISAVLMLETGIRHLRGTENRSVDEQLQDLLTLAESAVPIVAQGPWTTVPVNVHIKRIRVAKEFQTMNQRPVKLVELALQVREGA